jgi:branched-chain amino acid aminotransferase
MLAKKECERQGYFEPVFYNENDIITECAIRNIFFIKDKTLITPSLDLGILSGVMRNTIISLAKIISLNVLETHIKKEEINLMDEAFISSTGIGLLPCYWDNWDSKFETTIKLKKKLFNRINKG